jgi:hypothetical protein
MGIVALVRMALLPSSMRRHLCCCQASVVALVSCCQAGIVVLVVVASLPLMRRCLCHCRNCNCYPHDICVVAIVDAQVSLPVSSWHCCSHNNGIVALDLQQRCCPHYNDVIDPLCAGTIALIALVLSPLL